jgi:hypothetical protein
MTEGIEKIGTATIFLLRSRSALGENGQIGRGVSVFKPKLSQNIFVRIMNSFFHGLEKAVEDGVQGGGQMWKNWWNYEWKFDGRKPGVRTTAPFQL